MSIHGVANIRCPKCGGAKFTIVHRKYTVVDFSREGAIEDHPYLSNGGELFDSVFCDDCSEPIEGDMAQQILREAR